MQERLAPASRLSAILAIAALVLALLTPSTLGRDRGLMGSTLAVTHDAVQTTLTTAASDGHQQGDLRVTSIPVAVEGSDQVGRLDATLTTVGIDQPDPGDEVRISVLVFSFNDNADQIVVSGTAVYPQDGSTIAAASSVVRPVTGGSGEFAGATGWAKTEHLEDGTWRHTFHMAGPILRGMPERPTGHDMGRDLGGWGDRGRRGHGAVPSHASPGPEASAAPVGIIRTLLGSVAPSTAPGTTLALWHYTIPAGQALAPHVHPGYQVARIVSGTLTYNVLDGTADIIRADGTIEIATGGDVVILEPGDTVIENPATEHFGANAGSRPVIIATATLFTADEPPAIPLPSASPAA